MRWLRIGIYCFPVLLIFLAYHFLASLTLHETELGESINFAISTVPIGIDPLTEQDAISEEIEGLLFDRLLGRSPKMELQTHLAESWSYRSNVAYFYLREKHAEAAFQEFQKTKARWPSWGIVGEPKLRGTGIHIDLNSYQAESADQILDVLPSKWRTPVTKWRLRTDHSAADAVRSFADTAVEGHQLRHVYDRRPGEAEFFSSGTKDNFRRELDLYFDSNSQLKPVLTEVQEQPYVFQSSMTMHLRSGVRWHDGEPFTVDDVMHSIEMGLVSESQPYIRSAMEAITAIIPKRPYSFEIIFHDRFAPTLELWERLPILPAHRWHSYKPTQPDVPMVGTGPYVIGKWVPGSPIVINRNDDYYRGRPENKQFVYERVLENRLLRLLFETNAIDSYEAKPTTYRQLENHEKFALVKGPRIRHTFVAWNTAKEALRDSKVREALSWAINKQELIDELLGGYGNEVDRLFHPSSPFGAETVNPIGYDPKKAEELLRQAGFDSVRYGARYNGKTALSFKLTVIQGNEFQRDLGRALQRQWRKIDVPVQLHVSSHGEAANVRSSNEEFEAVLVTTPLNHYLDQHSSWHSTEIGVGRGNFTRLRDEQIDEIVTTIRQTFDEPKQKELAAKLQSRLHELQPCMDLFLSQTARVFQRDRAFVIDKTSKGTPRTRSLGDNDVSLTYDLAWWVKKASRPEKPPTTAAASPLN